MQYRPGLHILLSINNVNNGRLDDLQGWSALIDHLIIEHQLSCVGKVLYAFDSGGYTAVHCLTESHISIHTWPEFGSCTCDIFLSNFKNDNEDSVRKISDEIIKYFDTLEITKTELKR